MRTVAGQGNSKHMSVSIGSVNFDGAAPGFILGPCQIESRDHALAMAERIAAVCQRAGVHFVYKSSYDKANRTSLNGARGIGLEAGLRILEEVRDAVGCPVITDVHDPAQCRAVQQVVDAVQIPAFLCRQTDLLVSAAQTGLPVNIKKGQFLAPWDMAAVAAKVAGSGNDRIMLCERGTSFGYNTLVNDMRGLPIMADIGYPVIFDATHSVQSPGGLGSASGGDRQFVAPLARAAMATGYCHGVFIETHDDPESAPSDASSMLPLAELPKLLDSLKLIHERLW